MNIEPKHVAGGLVTAVAATAAVSDAQAQGMDGLYGGVSLSFFGGEVPTYSVPDVYSFVGHAVVGGFVGYNHMLGNNAFVGGEINFFSSQQIQPEDEDDENYNLSALIDLRLRAGYAVNDMVTVYGFAGVSNAVRSSYSYSREYSLYGGNFGIGGEYMLNESLGVGLEYTYRSLNAYDDWDVPQENSHSLSLRAAFHF